MAQSGPVAGSVESLWRYPVKSMAGEELHSSEVTERGLVGDRAFALVDEADGKVATAKNPRRWPQLFEFGAAYVDTPVAGVSLPGVRVTLPDGTAIGLQDTDADATLSRALNRDLRVRAAQQSREADDATRVDPWVARAEEYWPDVEGLDHRDVVTDFDLPEGMFFDAAVVHLMTRATLDRLSELYPQGQMAIRRFRPNIVVLTADAGSGFVENDWVGREVSIGAEVRLAVTGPCGRCVMVTLAQGGLPKDSGILRAVAQHNQLNAGVYASVLRGGEVRRGDVVTVQ